MSVLDHAVGYRRRGWSPIPVPHGKKRPVLEGWQDLVLTEEALPDYFNGRAQNVGILTGVHSSGLVDIDLDCPEAILLADKFLPPTNAVFGRASAPRCHRLYRCSEPGVVVRLRDHRKVTLVEYRATGGQTLVPPSVAESEPGKGDFEERRWVRDGEPASAHGPVLLGQVKKLAFD